MALYYSNPADVIKEAAIVPEDLDEANSSDLRARVERYLVGVKGLMDEYTNRDFHAEFGKLNADGVTYDYSDIPGVIHLIGLRAGVNAVLGAKDRHGPAARTEDEYKIVMFRDEILSISIRRELDLFKVRKHSSNTRQQIGFGMIRVRSPREIKEDRLAGRLR